MRPAWTIASRTAFLLLSAIGTIGKRISALAPGKEKLVASLPPSSNDRIVLELRCRGWIPKQLHAGSKDDRTLGVEVFGVTMRAAGSADKVFDANQGEWRRPTGPSNAETK